VNSREIPWGRAYHNKKREFLHYGPSIKENQETGLGAKNVELVQVKREALVVLLPSWICGNAKGDRRSDNCEIGKIEGNKLHRMESRVLFSVDTERCLQRRGRHGEVLNERREKCRST